MAYFIHNKYDRDSIAKVTTSDNINFTYNDDNTVTVIDYYGLLERGDNTYKTLDTTSMGINIIENLQYHLTTSETFSGTENVLNGMSNNSVKTSLFDILMDIVGKIGTSADLDTSTLFGAANHYYNKGVIKSIQRGVLSGAHSSTVTPTNKITIAAVNPNKSFVICGTNGTKGGGGAYVSAFTSTSITFVRTSSSDSNGTGYENLGWQVIEFV